MATREARMSIATTAFRLAAAIVGKSFTVIMTLKTNRKDAEMEFLKANAEAFGITLIHKCAKIT
jgi:hypothetical protein